MAQATPHEVVRLLEHHSPVVRAYLGAHVLVHQRDDRERVGPLLPDTTPMEAQIGCGRGQSTVASYVSDARLATPWAVQLLLAKSQGRGEVAHVVRREHTRKSVP